MVYIILHMQVMVFLIHLGGSYLYNHLHGCEIVPTPLFYSGQISVCKMLFWTIFHLLHMLYLSKVDEKFSTLNNYFHFSPQEDTSKF